VARGAVLALKITGDAKDGVRALNDADDASGKLGSTMGKLAAGAGAAIGVVGVLGKAAFDSASNLQQQAGAVDAIFGDNAAKMHDYAKQAANTVGLARSEYSELAAVLGAQLSNAGFAGEELTGTVDGLITRGADLAATFGGTTADAVAALSSVLKGETDPIERYGVSIKQSDISARLAAAGQDKLTGEALKNAQATAALGLVTEQTTASQGKFAGEADTAAGASQRLGAMWEDLKAKMGEKLLPVITDVMNFVKDELIPGFEKLTEKGGAVNTFLTNMGTFIKDEVLPVLKDLGQWAKDNLLPVIQDMGVFINEHALPAFESVWAFIKDYVIPILKDTLGPALEGIRDAFKTVSEKLDENKDKFQKIHDNMKPFIDFIRDKVAPLIGTVLKEAFETAGVAIGAVIDSVSWILEKGSDVIGWLTGASDASGGKPSGAARTMGAAGRPALFGASHSLLGASVGPAAAGQGSSLVGGTTVHITVNGALDPVAVADQIGRLLDNRARRIGAAPAFGGVRVA
jgi:hypothetical protein